MSLLTVLAEGSVYLWILVALIVGVLCWYLTVPSDLPPGTAGIPILGYLPFVGEKPFLTYRRLAKKYGPIFHLYFGRRLIIILNDYVAVKEAFIKQADVFSGRIRDGNFVRNDSERHGVVNDDGEYWKQHRRFVLTSLRDNGVGKLSLEPLLLNEVHYLIRALKKECGRPAAMRDLLYCSLSNNVHILVTGHRYDYDHPTIQKMIRALYSFAEHGQIVAYHTYFPWISRIPGANIITKHEERWNDMNNLISIARGIINGNTEANADYDNLVDSYMAKIKAKEVENDTKSIFSMDGLLHICRDLLTAGAETSSRTMLWGMIYLTNHPRVQEKVQKEIDVVIGQDRDPSYNDRGNTPYLVAMITEVHRIVSLVPLSLPHRNTRETKVLGYRIPKDSVIVPNLWAVNNDPALWGDPDNFRPERFINSDGKLFVPEYFVTFSVGKRACAGEPLARMELYLYFASLLQKFSFVSLDGAKLPLDASEKVTRSPLFDKICIKERDYFNI